jgi:hypothetical protein
LEVISWFQRIAPVLLNFGKLMLCDLFCVRVVFMWFVYRFVNICTYE